MIGGADATSNVREFSTFLVLTCSRHMAMITDAFKPMRAHKVMCVDTYDEVVFQCYSWQLGDTWVFVLIPGDLAYLSAWVRNSWMPVSLMPKIYASIDPAMKIPYST